ncbi:MAG: ribosome-binding factor A [Patescibacteria group bacterium]|nr:ribosome-binding factor A [Patescibacteria group bacterium]MDE1946174.1 ribosome-binding factor A [Patescibacteria group bacterium]
MPASRNEKILRIVKTAAADYLQRESSGQSLITVTDVRLSEDEKYATILFTVLPEEKERAALEFAKRMRSDFKEYVKAHTNLGKIPLFDFDIDRGEKHRQRIDEISRAQ